MGCLKVVGESLVSRIVSQCGLKSLGGCASFWGQPADGYPVASDDGGLAALDLIEDARDLPCRLGLNRTGDLKDSQVEVVAAQRDSGIGKR